MPDCFQTTKAPTTLALPQLDEAQLGARIMGRAHAPESRHRAGMSKLIVGACAGETGSFQHQPQPRLASR